MKSVKNIRIVLFQKGSENSEITRKFLSLKDASLIKYRDEEDLAYHIDSIQNKGYNSKEVLILKPFKGRFFQLCPGSPEVICCNYRVINTCFNCFYNCAYCFLSSYLNAFGIVQFTNIEEIYRELDNFIDNADKGMIYRIGTGEFTDSLMQDEVSGIGRGLIERYSSAANIMLELKTKSNNVDHLLRIKEKGNAVLAWSLNTQKNIARYEENSASLSERIEAAKMAGEAGFYLAFHFDPIIIYNGWREDYKSLIEKLFENVDADKVVWISMGGFRYSPGFKERVQDAFPDEEMTTEEMFPGIDGKLRYLKNKRVDIYKTVKGYINNFTEKPFLYLCMESSDVWNSVFNKDYTSSDMLEKDISDYLKKNFFNNNQ
ncbi:MAG: DNA photolyase [bacterium]|nr:DNA photolyase [bacterium]